MLGSAGVMVSGEGGAVVEGPSAGQPSRKEEVFTQRGGSSLPASDGFDRVSAQKKKKKKYCGEIWVLE